METVIAVGKYEDWDVAPMREAYDLHAIPSLSDIASLPEEVRTTSRVVLFKGHGKFDGDVMDTLPALGMIANFGVGYDSIDIEAARKRDIRVSNTPGVLSDDVADLAVAMLIAQSRQIVEGSDWVRSGAWAREGAMPLNRKVSGGRAGIIGLGRIGREIADRLAAFKIEIHYHSRVEKETPGWIYHPDPVSLARAVDYLFVALVGGVDTESYVSAEVLDALGHDGIIVNISRGSTIDEGALLDALETRRIRGAALDVYCSEPDIDPRFLALDNVLLQPHQGSATIETRQAMGQLQRDNAAAFLAGRDLLTPVV